MSFRRAVRRALDQVSCGSSTHSSSSEGEDESLMTGARVRPRGQFRYNRLEGEPDEGEGEDDPEMYQQQPSWGDTYVVSGAQDLDATLVAGSHEGSPDLGAYGWQGQAAGYGWAADSPWGFAHQQYQVGDQAGVDWF